MSITLDTIPSPAEMVKQIPLTRIQQAFIHSCRNTIASILQGRDKRKILVVGPCSIHEAESALEYASRLKELSNAVRSHYFIVMRTYVEKPRTIMGWKGFLYDPDLDGSFNMVKGIEQTRLLFSQLADLEIPCGSELLEINTAGYFSDFLSWGCIGARTAVSQPHRQLASAMPFPIGFKNTTDGNVLNAVYGMISAHAPHAFLGIMPDGKLTKIETQGNPHAHLILRGSELRPNYDPQSILEALLLCKRHHVLPRIFVDCAHGNSKKLQELQIPAFESASKQFDVVGLMLESHLHSGSQPITENLQYGISITDPCLDWESTEKLILSGCIKM